jgi:hypothetical protein
MLRGGFDCKWQLVKILLELRAATDLLTDRFENKSKRDTRDLFYL